MPGEGLIAHAIKNERSKWKNFIGSNKIPTKKLGKASPEQMQELKLQLNKEQNSQNNTN
jgi:hypothetical protein